MLYNHTRFYPDGDPLEIKGELYYVCENIHEQHSDPSAIGVIPLVVRNPAKVLNIKNYIQCLSLAHRKVQFKNAIPAAIAKKMGII